LHWREGPEEEGAKVEVVTIADPLGLTELLAKEEDRLVMVDAGAVSIVDGSSCCFKIQTLLTKLDAMG